VQALLHENEILRGGRVSTSEDGSGLTVGGIRQLQEENLALVRAVEELKLAVCFSAPKSDLHCNVFCG
jgi:hypothetical protein